MRHILLALMLVLLLTGSGEAEPLPQCNQYQHYDVRAMKCLPVEAWEPVWKIVDGTQSLLLIDEEVLKKMATEAQQIGGMLMVAPLFYDKTTQLWERVDYACYQRMREAMTHMDFWMESDHRRRLKGIPPISDMPLHQTDFWKSVMRDCVKETP